MDQDITIPPAPRSGFPPPAPRGGELGRIFRSARQGVADIGRSFARAWRDGPVAQDGFPPPPRRVQPPTHAPILPRPGRDELAQGMSQARATVEAALVRKALVSRAFSLGLARPCGEAWYETRGSWGHERSVTLSSAWHPDQCGGKPRLTLSMALRVSDPREAFGAPHAPDGMLSMSMRLEEPVPPSEEGGEWSWKLLGERNARIPVTDLAAMRAWTDDMADRMGVQAYTVAVSAGRRPSGSWAAIQDADRADENAPSSPGMR